jgi:hypothetical protein
MSGGRIERLNHPTLMQCRHSPGLGIDESRIYTDGQNMKWIVPIAILATAATLTAGCGGTSSNSDGKVWCVGPGEKVTAAFKREYPDLYIPKAACDAVNGS